MAQARSASPRSPREWIFRSILALAIALLGMLSVSWTLGYATRNADPEQAHTLAPGDGRVTALVARRLSDPLAAPADRARAVDLGRTALRQDPTAVDAVTTLGIEAQLRSDTRAARRLFAYSERLSRRELKTQFWGIEDAVSRGSIPEALRHYDIALRVSRTAGDLLFPILSSAITDSKVAMALSRTLAQRPPWGPSFINFASANADPRATMRLYQALIQMRGAVTEEPRSRLIGRLIDQGMAANAWAFYAYGRPGIDRSHSRDPHFTAVLAVPTPFDWVAVDAEGVATTIRPGSVDFTAPVSVGGPLLRQIQLLPPGRYRLSGRASGIDQVRDSLPYWTLTCGHGAELGRVDVPPSGENGRSFAGEFVVPVTCPIQILTLVAKPSDAIGGLSGQIDAARLVPVTADRTPS